MGLPGPRGLEGVPGKGIPGEKVIIIRGWHLNNFHQQMYNLLYFKMKLINRFLILS